MVRRRFMNNAVIGMNKYLTITALEDGLTIKFPFEIEYNIDGIGWEVLQANSETSQVRKGSYIFIRGNVVKNISTVDKGFTINGAFDLSGNCLSLIYKDKANGVSSVLTPYCFVSLFQNTNVRNVSKDFLPSTTLANYCYNNMFAGCTNLTQAPELPAVTLASGCYYSMFAGCTNLTQAPELPAVTLASDCYNNMFAGCTNLTQAPELPAVTLASDCYYSMFAGCTNLTQAPELPAVTLASGCYVSMFSNCTKLNYIKAMFTTKPSNFYTYNWVKGVASTGKFIKNKNATWNVTATSSNYYIGIPSGWSIQSAAQ